MIRRAFAAFRRNPYPVFALLRRFAPVLRIPRYDIWVLSTYDDVKTALTDSASFSSRAAPPGGEPLDWLIFLDPPQHSKLRAIIARTFTPRSIAELEPRIRELSAELLDAACRKDSVDLVADYAAPLPMLVIAEMLGIPTSDRPRFIEWTNSMLGLGDAVAGGARAQRATARFRAATAEMKPYLSDLLEQRRQSPRDDLLSRLVTAEVDGEKLSEAERLAFFQLLLFAGSETTTNLISNMVLCWIDYPDQLALLKRSPDLLPQAIEEVIRHRSPVHVVFRQTVRDVVIRGRRIPAGKLVLPLVGSANRDSAKFARAHEFDIVRQPAGHVGFGHGIHFCIGAALARLEARVAIGDLLARFDRIRVPDGESWTPRAGLNVHGPSRLPVILERKAV